MRVFMHRRTCMPTDWKTAWDLSWIQGRFPELDTGNCLRDGLGGAVAPRFGRRQEFCRRNYRYRFRRC